jgi:HEAT repeat protein
VLIDVLTDTDVRIRREAAVTIGRFVRPSDPLAERAMSALTRALGDDDAEVRLNAAEAILNIGTRKQL